MVVCLFSDHGRFKLVFPLQHRHRQHAVRNHQNGAELSNSPRPACRPPHRTLRTVRRSDGKFRSSTRVAGRRGAGQTQNNPENGHEGGSLLPPHFHRAREGGMCTLSELPSALLTPFYHVFFVCLFTFVRLSFCTSSFGRETMTESRTTWPPGSTSPSLSSMKPSMRSRTCRKTEIGRRPHFAFYQTNTNGYTEKFKLPLRN